MALLFLVVLADGKLHGCMCVPHLPLSLVAPLRAEHDVDPMRVRDAGLVGRERRRLGGDSECLLDAGKGGADGGELARDGLGAGL